MTWTTPAVTARVAEEHEERCRRVTPDSRASCEPSRQGVGLNGSEGRHIGNVQYDCFACSTSVLVVHLCPHCSFIFNWLELLHAILTPHSRLFTRNAVPPSAWGHLGGPGKSGQVDEIESDAPPPSSTRYGGQATIAIVFSDFIQTFEPRELATGGSGSRFAVCAENTYAAHAGPHDCTRAVLRVAATPMKHSQHWGSRMRPSTQSRDDRTKSRSLRTSRIPGDPLQLTAFRGLLQTEVRRRCRF